MTDTYYVVDFKMRQYHWVCESWDAVLEVLEDQDPGEHMIEIEEVEEWTND